MVLEHQLTLRLLTLCCLGVALVYTQTIRDGQIYTNGLAIVNTPAIGTTLHANSDLHLSIDVSGDGKLGEDAWSPPGSGLATSYDSLNIFLTSAEQKSNFTVSTGPGLLTQEPGSTVKHLNWPIPACILQGQYELTLCESSHINGTPHFSITALPLEIENDMPIGQPCTSGLNDYQQVMQASSPPPTSPSVSGNVTLPKSSLGFPTPDSSGGLPGPGPTPSSTPPRPTSSKGPLATGTSVVGSGQGIRFTTIITDGRNPTIQTSSSTTFTTTTTDLSDGSRGAGNSEFFPINRGKSIRPISKSLFAVVLWSTVCALG